MKHILSIIGLSLLGFALAFSQSGVGGKGGFGGKGGSGGGTTATASPSIVQPTVANPLDPACAQFSTTNTCAYPLNVTSGNQGFVQIIANNTGTISTPTKSAGTATIGTITAVGAGCNVTGATCGGAQQWYTFAITGSGSLTISETFSSGLSLGVLLFEVSNYHSVDTSPLYHAVSSSFCTSACALVSITPGTTSDLILAGLMTGNTGDTYTVTPYTLSGSGLGTVGNDVSWFTANYTAPSTSAISATFTPLSGLGGNSYQDSALAVK